MNLTKTTSLNYNITIKVATNKNFSLDITLSRSSYNLTFSIVDLPTYGQHLPTFISTQLVPTTTP